jgi:hypothetical protein
LATPYTSNRVVQTHLAVHLAEIEKAFAGDVLTYFGPISYGADQAIRDAVEGIDKKQGKLVFILETPGGFAEIAKRISDTVRQHYPVVDFLIPGHAMSAGTILAMSGDAIFMDYYSVLGPIDPQVPDGDGNLVPALGYLVQYDKLLKKANSGKVSTAEMQLLLSFDQTRLYAYEQSRDLSRTLLQEWLVKYKFKDWSETETKKIKVTAAMKKRRAKEVADKLNNVRLWNSHGIGISMDRLRKDINLRIDDFGRDLAVSRSVRMYHALLTDFMARMGHRSVLHTRSGYEPLMVET